MGLIEQFSGLGIRVMLETQNLLVLPRWRGFVLMVSRTFSGILIQVGVPRRIRTRALILLTNSIVKTNSGNFVINM